MAHILFAPVALTITCSDVGTSASQVISYGCLWLTSRFKRSAQQQQQQRRQLVDKVCYRLLVHAVHDSTAEKRSGTGVKSITAGRCIVFSSVQWIGLGLELLELVIVRLTRSGAEILAFPVGSVARSKRGSGMQLAAQHNGFQLQMKKFSFLLVSLIVRYPYLCLIPAAFGNHLSSIPLASDKLLPQYAWLLMQIQISIPRSNKKRRGNEKRNDWWWEDSS